MIALIVLLAATVTAQPKVDTFAAPKGHLPTEIARQGDKMVVISWTNWPQLEPHLGTIDAKGKLQSQPLDKDYMPGLFAAAKDGTMWLTDVRKPVLWHIGQDGKVEKVEIDRPTQGIAVDIAGQLWCTHPNDTEISRYQNDGTRTATLDTGRGRFKLAQAKPQKVPAGMQPTWAKQSQKANRRDVTPTWLVNGAETDMWFSDPTMRSIGIVTSDGHQQRFKLPTDMGQPGPVVYANGLAWFTLAGKPVIGQVSREGFFSSVDVHAPVDALATDAKGRVWFSTASDLGYVESDGTVRRVALPKGGRTIHSMAAGADGAMWFVDQKAKVIGRVMVP
ncbi:MAG: Vgb family protein [Thermoanaerobaculia bacterium]